MISSGNSHLKPTYEGLKDLPSGFPSFTGINLKPTYEGLKVITLTCSSDSITYLKPTYEGLKGCDCLLEAVLIGWI